MFVILLPFPRYFFFSLFPPFLFVLKLNNWAAIVIPIIWNHNYIILFRFLLLFFVDLVFFGPIFDLILFVCISIPCNFTTSQRKTMFHSKRWKIIELRTVETVVFLFYSALIGKERLRRNEQLFWTEDEQKWIVTIEIINFLRYCCCCNFVFAFLFFLVFKLFLAITYFIYHI